MLDVFPIQKILVGSSTLVLHVLFSLSSFYMLKLCHDKITNSLDSLLWESYLWSANTEEQLHN